MAENNAIQVNCVYGPDHIQHIREVLAPSLAEAADSRVAFNCLPYIPGSNARLGSFEIDGVGIIDHDNPYDHSLGFAEAHNTLLNYVPDQDFFILMNPDCIATAGCLDILISRYSRSGDQVGIVEGRQWPFEHPKEYDPFTLETPWSSGAFCLINTKAFKKLGGFDDRYHMYVEDVDLSWRMWNAGYSVLYERDSCIVHFSGGRFYRDDLIETEKYFSARNFILLSRKFFGPSGEEKAWGYVKGIFPEFFCQQIKSDIDENFKDFEPLVGNRATHNSKIKILGFCQFHELS